MRLHKMGHRRCSIRLVAVIFAWHRSSVHCLLTFGPIGNRCRASARAATAADSVLQAISQVEDTEMRNETLQAYFQTQLAQKDFEKSLMQKDLEKQLAQKDLEKDLVQKDLVQKDFEKQLVQKDVDNMRKELLQAKGLLTARGVYERVAQQAWDEQKDAGNVKGGCNVANSLAAAAKYPQAGRWSKLLYDVAQKCDAQTDVEMVLRQVWRDLSQQVHGFPWSGPEVKIDTSLSETGTCIVQMLCRDMGLITDTDTA